MIALEVLAQVAEQGVTSEEALIYMIAYTAGFLLLALVAVIKFRIAPQIEDWLIEPYIALAVVLFLFGAGGYHYPWPFPGAIWAFGITLLTFLAGYCMSYTVYQLAGITKR